MKFKRNLQVIFWLYLFGLNHCSSDPKADDVPDLKINVFYDISASMDGLLFQPTQASSDIQSIGTELSRNNRDVKYYALSDTILQKMTVDSVWNLFGGAPPNRSGDSRLDQMIRRVRENTHNGEVSLFVTDGIYSLGTEDIQGYYRNHPNHPNDRFMEVLLRQSFTNLSREFNALADNNFSIRIYRYLSDFEQTPETPYYNFNNNLVDPRSRRNIRRAIRNEVYNQYPWYIMAIGQVDDVRRFTMPFAENSAVVLELPLPVIKVTPTPYMEDDYFKNVSIENDTLVVQDVTQRCSFGGAINLTESEIDPDVLPNLAGIGDVVPITATITESEPYFKGKYDKVLNKILKNNTHFVFFSEIQITDDTRIRILRGDSSSTYIQMLSCQDDRNGPCAERTFGFDKLITAAIRSFTANEVLDYGVLIIPFNLQN